MGMVFISYRRDDSDFAHRLAEKLTHLLDDTTFVDTHNMEEDIVQAIDQALTRCHVYVLVVTPHTFDPNRINRPDDWIRYEAKTALTLKKPIALALADGMPFPPLVTTIPNEIRPILTKQGIPFPRTFFDEASLKLADHLVHISNGALRRKPATVITADQVRRRIKAIDDAILSSQSSISSRTKKNPAEKARMDALLEERRTLVELLKTLI